VKMTQVRLFALSLAALVSAATLIPAALAPAAAAAEPALEASNIEFARDVPVVPMAEWEIDEHGRAEQTGARIPIAAGAADTAKAPANASRYDSQTFSFSPGVLRVLKFTAANGGVLHQITSETEIYVLKGSATVGVRGTPTVLHAGDVVNLPSGVLRSIPGKLEDTTILAYTVGSTAKDPKAVFISGREVKNLPLPAGPKGGMNGAHTSVRRYAFDGNSIRVAELTGRGSTAPYTGNTDVIIYIASGHLQITVGDEVKDVSAGDVLREQAGLPSFWKVSGKATFVATNSPFHEVAARQP